MLKSRYIGQDKSVHKRTAKVGVLLTNLGTPDAPEPVALKRYLREFLSDPRVVEIPKLVWWIILHGIILRVRPKKSAKLYQSIWTDEGSPLLVFMRRIRDKVAKKLMLEQQSEVVLDIAMRYGSPAISEALTRFQKLGIDKFIILPLYPQYGGPTTASTYDAVTQTISKWRWIPSIHFINGYHNHPLYINALTNSIQAHIDTHGKPDKLLLSYHGMPKHFLDSGDPYYCFCHQTTQLVAAQLGLLEGDFITTFQSRFGKAEWLKPYTDQTLEELAKQGCKHVAIISPAFSVDCLETLEELEEENREIFIEAGGEQYHYIPALNDNEDHVTLISDIIEQYL
ncbi:ferrochelatase [Thalassotalea sp. PP2-459]|uniref:ferrochelatase n=1 Tax=Thalassotalea sp. PP2-459 TaxID=1742724 RepID=UPI0009432EC7|nr:ferrochelatase [Thalassotalea sp. PP2-459]OKY26063.1 ferrochelatase [Thalassotalea sp. PP2-459]